MQEPFTSWELVLQELKRVLDGGAAEREGILSLQQSIYELCGPNLPPREMWKHIPSDVREQVKTVFVAAMANGSVSRVHDMLWYVGVPFGLWRRHPQETGPEAAIQGLAYSAIEVAKGNEEFGIACALADLASNTRQSDKLRGMARANYQRIALDYAGSLFQTFGQ